MVIKMLTEVRTAVHEQSKNFNKQKCEKVPDKINR